MIDIGDMVQDLREAVEEMEKKGAAARWALEYAEWVAAIDFQPALALIDGFGQPTCEKTSLPLHALGLVEEAGEVAGKVKKLYRDSHGILCYDKKQEIASELGDVLWYLTAICNKLDYSLEELAASNKAKVLSRQQRGTMRGSGDER